MKRFFPIILSAILFLPLAACQNAKPAETTATTFTTPSPTATATAFSMAGDDTAHRALEEKFDHLTLSSEKASYTHIKSAVSGGAILEFPLETLSDTPVRISDETLYTISVFDEESLEVIPLCFEPGCDHTNDVCFSRTLGTDALCYAGVTDGDVFSVGGSFEDGRPCIAADFYSFGGVKRNRSVFFTDCLIRSDGSFAASPEIAEGYARSGTKVYFVVHDRSDEARSKSDSDSVFTRWILCFDIEMREFSYVGSFDIPYAEDTKNDILAHIVECTDSYLSVSWQKHLHIFNLSSGEHKVIDTDSIFDDLQIRKGIIEGSFAGENLICIRDYENYFWYDTELDGEAVPSFQHELKISNDYSFFFSQNRYFVTADSGTGSHYLCREDGEHGVSVDPTVDAGKNLRISSLHCETEKGLIFQCAIYDENGEYSVENNFSLTEDGKEVFYRYPQKFVYVAKSDYSDGKIDSPLYYDPETGAFSE